MPRSVDRCDDFGTSTQAHVGRLGIARAWADPLHSATEQARGESYVWSRVGRGVEQGTTDALIAPQELRIRRGVVE